MKIFLLFGIFMFSYFFATSQNGTWIEQTVPYDSGWVNKIVYADSVSAWAIGQNKRTDKAVIISNLDNGTNWTLQDESLNGTLRNIFMVDKQTGYAVGRGNNGKVAMLKTSDGQNWEELQLPDISGVLFDVAFTSRQKGCAVGVNTQGLPTILPSFIPRMVKTGRKQISRILTMVCCSISQYPL